MNRGYGRGTGDFRDSYKVIDRAQKEKITYSLWERLSYVSGTTTELVFFQAQQSGINGNMTLAGQLPRDFEFLCQAIRFAPMPATTETATAAAAAGTLDGALQDMLALTRDCFVTFKILEKDYGSWPAWVLPAGGGPYGLLSTNGTHAAGSASMYMHATNGVPDPRAVYSLPVPVVIPEQTTFRLTARWDAAKTLTAGNTPIICILDGQLIRPKQ